MLTYSFMFLASSMLNMLSFSPHNSRILCNQKKTKKSVHKWEKNILNCYFKKEISESTTFQQLPTVKMREKKEGENMKNNDLMLKLISLNTDHIFCLTRSFLSYRDSKFFL